MKIKKFYLNIVICVCLSFLLSGGAGAYSGNGLAERLAGYIVLQVESNGEAWYIHPDEYKRYYLGRPDDAFGVMREFGLGISHDELERYLTYKFPARLSGRIMLDVEKNGEAYYIYPKDLKGYYLGRPADAFKVMRDLGMGISNQDLELIYTDNQIPVNNSEGRKDNDGDGLYNYEEIQIYHTNPDLPDTDYDGNNDFAEIWSNNDPLSLDSLEPYKTAEMTLINITKRLYQGDLSIIGNWVYFSEQAETILNQEFGIDKETYISITNQMVSIVSPTTVYSMNYYDKEIINQDNVLFRYDFKFFNKNTQQQEESEDFAHMINIDGQWYLNLEKELKYYQEHDIETWNNLKLIYGSSGVSVADQLCHDKYGEFSYSGYVTADGIAVCHCQDGYFWENKIGTDPNQCVPYTLNQVDSDGDGIYDDFDLHPSGGDKKTSKVYYPMDYLNNIEYRLEFSIAGDYLYYYENLASHNLANDLSNISDFITVSDPTITTIASLLYDLEQDNLDVCTSCLVIDFIQGLDYIEDFKTGYDEYAKYPAETLMDGTGDCEDTSVLMASIFKALGHDLVMFEYPGHVALGIYLGEDQYSGNYFDYGGKKYYFIETTGKFDIGEIPDDLIGIKPNIIKI